MITHEEIVDKLGRFVKAKGSLRKAAKDIGVSHAYLFDILRGNRPISGKVAKFLGYEKVVPPTPEPFFLRGEACAAELADDIPLP